MKKIYLLTLSIVALNFVNAQCTDFFLSEYVEGWSNNKAVEIYNPFNTAKSLDGYGLQRYRNGALTPSNTTELSGIVAPYDVYVVVLDKRDPQGSGNEAPVWDDLQLKADTFVSPNYNGGSEALYFNGDDAMVLVKNNGTTIVDIFGVAGEQPDPGWGPYTDGNGDDASWSQDHTLIRKATVTDGVTTNPTSFDPSVEWDSLPANTFTELQMHTCDCQTMSVEDDLSQETLGVFPNPVIGDFFFVRAKSTIEKVELFDLLGKQVLKRENEEKTQGMKVEAFNLPESVYLLKATLQNGRELVRKVSIN